MDNSIWFIHSYQIGKNKGILSIKNVHTHKIKELSTSYKQNVDNFVKNICIRCEYAFIATNNRDYEKYDNIFSENAKICLTLKDFLNIIEAMFL